ncbi:MAG: hypothetical protein AAF805_03155 [Planctomycetota bacterium]
MANAFDPYREALVVEELTLWSDDARNAVADWSGDDRSRLARKLHREAATADSLDYVRVHTGFCRQITVQPADVDRFSSDSPSGAG